MFAHRASHRTHRLALILGIASAYFIAGRLGLLLAIPPGYASPVWPAAGIALAALLLAGRGAAVGVFFGSFLTNVGVSFDASDGTAIARSIGLALALATGATLQALVGVSLVRRWVGFPTVLTRERNILRFLILGGPIACLVSASAGPTSLVGFGLMPWGDWATSWLHWWIGDAIGVMLVIPLVLVWAAEPRSLWRARRRSVAIPLGVAATVTIVVFAMARESEQRRHGDETRRRAEAVFRGATERFEVTLDVLRSVNALLASVPQASPETFSAFVRHQMPKLAGVRAMSWNLLLTDAERDTFEATRPVMEQVPGLKELHRAERRPLYDVVHVIEPPDENRGALGYDVLSEPRRAKAVQRATDTGQPMGTSVVELVQDHAVVGGMIVYLPVYRFGSRPETVEARRESVVGHVAAVFSLQEMMVAGLGAMEGQGLRVEVSDVTEVGATHLYSGGQAAGRSAPVTSEYEMAGRRWSIGFSPTASFEAQQQTWHVWLVLIGGLLLASTLGAFLLTLVGQAALEMERSASLAGMNEALRHENLEHLRAEEALEETHRQLKHRSEEMERFIYTVSHDLKSPIVTNLCLVDLIEQDLKAGDLGAVSDALRRIHRSSSHMLQSMSDLLELVRVGRQSSRPEEVEVSKIIAEVATVLAPRFASAGARIDIAENLPTCTSDQGHLGQVLENLLTNALKYGCGMGKRVVEVGGELAGDEVRLFVRDHGQGVPHEYQERIFLLFQRLDKTKEGTGVGLTIVAAIMRQLGGRVWIDSQVGRGATFWLALPRVTHTPMRELPGPSAGA